MKIHSKLSAGLAAAGCLVLTSMFSPLASATDLFDFSGAITAGNSQALNDRLSRNGVQQDWINTEAYPGTIGSGTFNYLTFLFTPAQLGNGKFVQIEIEDPNPNVFASAYMNSFSSSNFQTNWLGDAGQSRDYAFGSIPPTPQDPRFFQVIVPTGSSLVVVLNTSSAAGLGEAFSLHVENFSDVSFSDVTAVPEPTSMALLGVGGLLGVVGVARRRRQRVA